MALVFLLGFLILVLLSIFVLFNSYVKIPKGKIGVITASFIFFPSVSQNWPYRLVPRWHNGVWASHLVTGWRFLLFHKIWSRIELRDIPVIQADKRGYVESLVGQDIPQGRVMMIEDYDFSDAQAFILELKKDHFRGPSAKMLSPGAYNIFAKVIGEDDPLPTDGDWPFVIREISVTHVRQGEGLVLLSKVGDVPSSDEWVKRKKDDDKEERVDDDKKERVIEGLINFKGSIGDIDNLRDLKKGIVNKAFGPGDYFFHPVMFQILIEDTTPMNVCFLKNRGQDGNDFPEVTVFTKDPYEFVLEFEIGVRVNLSQLPSMIAISDSMKGLKRDVINPQANDVVYRVAATITLADFIENRRDKFVKIVIEEFTKEIRSYSADFLYFRFLDIKFSPEAQDYIRLRTRQIEAAREVEVVKAEKVVADERIGLQHSVALANAQNILADAELQEQAAESLAAATKTKGESLQTFVNSLKDDSSWVKIIDSILISSDGLNQLLAAVSHWLSVARGDGRAEVIPQKKKETG